MLYRGFMRTFLGKLTAWTIFLGTSALALHYVDKEPDTTIQIKILKTELDNAHQICHNLGQIGHVTVFDSTKQYKTLSCTDIPEMK